MRTEPGLLHNTLLILCHITEHAAGARGYTLRLEILLMYLLSRLMLKISWMNRH